MNEIYQTIRHPKHHDNSFLTFCKRLLGLIAIVLITTFIICYGNVRFGPSSCNICRNMIVKQFHNDNWEASTYLLALPLFFVSVMAYWLDFCSSLTETRAFTRIYRFLGVTSKSPCLPHVTDDPQEQCDLRQTGTRGEGYSSICSTQTHYSSPTNCYGKWSKLKKWYFTRFIGGSPKKTLWSFILIVCPAIYVTLHATISTYRSVSYDRFGKVLEPKWERCLSALAQTSGYAAVSSLSFFLIPVTRHSIFLSAIGWNPIHDALLLHIWAGYVCSFSSLVHVLLYCWTYGKSGVEEGKDFLLAVLEALIPPRHCFRLAGPMSFLESDIYSACYVRWRNFSGLISAISLLLLIMTSLKFVRRNNYRVFYFFHIVFGPLMLLFAIIHFRYIVLYILPSLLYYFCTTSPHIIQMIASFCLDQGVTLKQASIIQNSGGCAEMVFPKTAACDRFEKSCSPLYVRVCVPEISLIWHPFTVASNHDKDSLKILFRQYGYFTRKLVQRFQCLNQPPPIILIDGYYFGKDWTSSALNHDTILIVAGGVGITPFLSLIRNLYEKILELKNNVKMGTDLRKVEFHWICRDKGLIRFVLQHHLSYLWCKTDCEESFSKVDKEREFPVHFQFCIHYTKETLDDTTSFHLNRPLSIKRKMNNNDNCIGSIHGTTTCTSQEGPKIITSVQSRKTASNFPKDELKQSEPVIGTHPTHPSGTQDDISGSVAIDSTKHTNSVLHEFPLEHSYHSSQTNFDIHNKNFRKVEDCFVRTYNNNKGVFMEISRFMLGFQSGSSLLFFSISYLGGLWIHWFLYQNYVQRYHEALFVRGYSTYATFLWTLIVGLIYEIYQRCFCRSNRRRSFHLLRRDHAEEGDDDFGTHLTVEEEDTNEEGNNNNTKGKVLSSGNMKSNSSSLKSNISNEITPFQCQVDDTIKISLEIENGRPDLYEIVKGAIEADHPGAFFCGPSGLLETVKKHIERGRIQKYGRLGTRCCIYSENFES